MESIKKTIFLTRNQGLQSQRQLGPPGQRAQQGRHLQPGARPPAHRHPRQRAGQQRCRHGAEAAPLLAQARAAVLVGGRRARGRRRRRGQAQGVDPEGVDAGDERHRAALTRRLNQLALHFIRLHNLRGMCPQTPSKSQESSVHRWFLPRPHLFFCGLFCVACLGYRTIIPALRLLVLVGAVFFHGARSRGKIWCI